MSLFDDSCFISLSINYLKLPNLLMIFMLCTKKAIFKKKEENHINFFQEGDTGADSLSAFCSAH